MKNYAQIGIGLIVLLSVACAGPTADPMTTDAFAANDTTANDTISDWPTDTLSPSPVVSTADLKPNEWKSKRTLYPHFKNCEMDTVYIGPNREIKDPATYFSEERFNVFVYIDSAEYITSAGIWISGENIIVKGADGVSILCDKLYENVMWVTADNVVIDNLHMMHLMRGTLEGQNCSGRVMAFDGADNVTVVNCDLNGCGLAGLHDNLGNGTIYIENNYIHNNSLGAYTDIDGGIWQEEVNDHPVFKFKANLILNNGFERVLEEEIYDYEDEH